MLRQEQCPHAAVPADCWAHVVDRIVLNVDAVIAGIAAVVGVAVLLAGACRRDFGIVQTIGIAKAPSATHPGHHVLAQRQNLWVI